MGSSRSECSQCGSSDGVAQYGNGTYCFACHRCTFADSPTNRIQKPTVSDLLTVTPSELRARGISARICQQLGYGVADCDGQFVQVANCRNDAGAIVAQHIRLPGKDFRVRGDIRSAVFFGRHAWSDGGRRVVVTEGQIDALSVAEMEDGKWPVVSLNQGASAAEREFRHNLEWLERFEEVIICFDNDEPGQKAAIAASEVLSPGKVKIMHLPLKDANEMLLAGRREEFIQAKWNASTYRPEGIIYGQALLDHLLRPIPQGLPIPHSGLQRYLQGLRPKELWLVAGGPGSGKSLLCRSLARHFALAHETKVGYIALEESVQQSLLESLSPVAGRRLRLGGGDPAELTHLLQESRMMERFAFVDHRGSMQGKELLGKIRWLAKGWYANLIVLDHITISISGDDAVKDERVALDRLMTQLRTLVEETGVSMFVVTHLRQDQKTSWDDGAEIRLHHMRGTSQLGGLADIVVGVERDQQAEDPVVKSTLRLRVIKNRPAGLTGLAGEYLCDPATTALTEPSMADAYAN